MIKSILIGHINYDVVEQKRITDDAQHGSNNSKNRTITLDSTNPKDIQIETLIHESIHGIWEYFDMRDKEDEESVCTKLSAGLCTLFKNNPELYKMLGTHLKIK